LIVGIVAIEHGYGYERRWPEAGALLMKMAAGIVVASRCGKLSNACSCRKSCLARMTVRASVRGSVIARAGVDKKSPCR
jgi:hypothetical protein